LSPEVSEWWGRALASLEAARLCIGVDPNSAASRAYYAAFEAVQALLARDAIEVWKHTAVREHVHRDLVKTGLWPKALGEDFNDLLHWRAVGDYVTKPGRVTAEKATALVGAAERILAAVRAQDPGLFGPVDR
jgi:uncharacterized protein (UPF0332 family)